MRSSCCTAILTAPGTTRAAVYALTSLGCSVIYLINRDPAETQSIVDHFPQLKLVAIDSVDQIKSLLAANAEQGVRMPVVVGAIPAIAPVTDAEKMVYDVARALFAQPDLPDQTHPKERYFLESALEQCDRARAEERSVLQAAADADDRDRRGLGLAQRRRCRRHGRCVAALAASSS